MKISHRIFAALIFAASALGVSAQVDNYAVRFTGPEGIVNLGSVKTFKAADDYTLQLWINPEKWTKGASVIRCGKFSIKLGVERAIILNDGTNHLTITDKEFGANKWTHLTIRSNASGTTVSVNNSKDFTLDTPLLLPADTKSIWLGGDFTGRVDEVRLWNGQLPTDYTSYWQNTLNELMPSWDSLAAYWKMDQELCENLVDYKGSSHGTFTPTGVEKSKVTDNAKFRYLTNLAYGNIERFFDRAVDKRHYSLSNRIALIGAEVNPSTLELDMRLDRFDAELNGATVAADGTRENVLVLDGTKTVTLPGGVLGEAPANYAFETWICVDEWVPGATIFSKGTAFTVKLGQNGKLAVNDKEINLTLETGKWTHIGVASSSTGYNVKVGSNSTSVTASNVTLSKSSVAPKIGENFKGKLDEIMIWKGERTVAQMINDATNLPLADDQKVVTGAWYRSMDACYLFDDANEPGFDSFSVHRVYRTMRSFTKGMRGVKFVLTVSFNPFKADALNTAAKRSTLAKNLAAVGNDPDFDGIDFDFEWPENGAWYNVSLVFKEVRQLLDPSKEMTSTPHAFYYNYPVENMADVDHFYFQIYGPNRTDLFKMPQYISCAQAYINHGYPKDKMVMSYATTTTGGWTSATGGSRVASGHPGFYPAGYRGIYNSTVQPSDNVIWHEKNACYYHLTGFDQTIERCQYILDNDLGGIMYWDLGNDLAATHQYSLARGASYVINSNVETLVTKVDTAAPAPADDKNGPEKTEDPADQGGFDPAISAQAIAIALQLYGCYPGYHAIGSEARAEFLQQINLVKLGMSDAVDLENAIEKYVSTPADPIGGPINERKYYVYGVNSNEEESVRMLYHSGTSLSVTSHRPDEVDGSYEWIAEVTANGFYLRNAAGYYIQASTGDLVKGKSGARLFPIVAGNQTGRLQLTMSEDKYLVTHYNETTRETMALAITADANTDDNNPKLWSSQWVLEPVVPITLKEYSVTATDGAAIVIDDDIFAGNNTKIYYDPDIDLPVFSPNTTNVDYTIDNDARTITVNATGLTLNKVYRFQNLHKPTKYLSIDEDKMLVAAPMDEHNPQQLFRVTRTATDKDKYTLAAQGVYIGEAAHEGGIQNGTSASESHYYIVNRNGNQFAFDHVMPFGGTFVNGSRALSVPTEGDEETALPVTTWATGTAYSWWIPEEVTEIEIDAIEIGDKYYADVTLPFAFSTAAHVYTGQVNGTNLDMTEIDNQFVPAGEPVIIEAQSEKITLKIIDDSETAHNATENHLIGHLFAADAPETAYVIGNNNNKPALFAEQQLSGRNRAYIHSSMSNEMNLLLNFNDISNISEITLPGSNEIYDLQGRRLYNPGRGLYIINGHKQINR